jgi:carnitine 3-dehydrogenase
VSVADGTPQVSSVGIVGAGVIGSGWVMHFLRMGLDVQVYDPFPGTDERLRREVEETWETLAVLGLRDGASPDRLSVSTSLEDVVGAVDFVQESSPENLESKIDVFARMDAAAADGVVLATSTSGLSITAIQSGCANPERVIVGHPFNPPYIMPLVEVVRGERTDKGLAEWTTAFYEHYGKRPILLEVEVPGFVATRLQEALWREMLHIVAEGEATVEPCDAAVVYGPGPRWAFMGPALTFHLGGGEGGMAATLDQFGPTLQEPWSRLMGPELTEELSERLIEGANKLAAGRSIPELRRERDLGLIELMSALDRVTGVKEDK